MILASYAANPRLPFLVLAGEPQPKKIHSFTERESKVCSFKLSGDLQSKLQSLNMAKRELSSTLKNLRFMQRAAHREEKAKKEEEVKSETNFISPDTVQRKCVVIMEGDPHPGAIMGRMSFQSFNPSIDKLNEAAANADLPEASATRSSSQIGRNALRENGSSEDGAECLKADIRDGNGDLKRKQSEVDSEQQYPNKSPKNVLAGKQVSPSDHKNSHKQAKHEKLDWSVLRPLKFPNKKSEQN